MPIWNEDDEIYENRTCAPPRGGGSAPEQTTNRLPPQVLLPRRVRQDRRARRARELLPPHPLQQNDCAGLLPGGRLRLRVSVGA
jgi:hypothetical protein